jgi:Rps23 Pro-64 3,4-dihydroxylase Tpa1-like proline 4-hydroxylase
MNHTEAIIEIKNIINPKFIKKIIPLINKKCNKSLKIDNGVINRNIRNVQGYHLTFDTPTDLFYWNYIKNEVIRLYSFYKSKFPKLYTDKVCQIDLLKYSPGGKYEIHTDHYSRAPRSVSVIMNLNDNYEGGSLFFTDQKGNEIKELKLNKGSIVFFPSNFMYPHGIKPIIKGIRYSIVLWLQ